MSDIVIYEDGNVVLDAMVDAESIWLSQKQIAELFDVKVPAVSKHLKNIFNSGELDEKVVVSKMEMTTKHGAVSDKTQTKNINIYNLDSIISIGYRINSRRATQFRIWATNVLKDHLIKGYTINNERLQKNYDEFLRVVEDMKVLSQNADSVKAGDVLELIKSFSATWFGLDSYDREELPQEGISKVNLEFEVEKLYKDVAIFKEELMKKGEASEIFATEKTKKSLEGIVGNVFQSVFGEDAYPTVEEKAAHLLYFIVKNHPFNDGNKRTGAFSFVWLLKRAGFDVEKFINPNALTALTLLIAESNPNDKDRMVGLVLLMLRD
ncbi:death-on-curing protein [Sulfurovum lithotrophicum]|uniref:Death-on-curing protein n=1 Tax=Sulfurovum lithotrophicum TaxID=206403 RepID=A0A7U4M336_9BACT|nr:virulence protein RhuM/Fic/DOC family protein [Sulfurovum lithotrophicum]AKF25979.1 death-on-curing protein [Sulfurovum lithotrophicum]